MPFYSIECAQSYSVADHSETAIQLRLILSKLRNESKDASLVALVDDTTYEDKAFNFDQYANWLSSEGFTPDLVARESQIVDACDALREQIDFTKLEAELAAELAPVDSYNSQLFIAAWCLVRLAYIESAAFDPSLQAEKLINILPASFKPGEDQSLAIIGATPYFKAVDKIEYVFVGV